MIAWNNFYILYENIFLKKSVLNCIELPGVTESRYVFAGENYTSLLVDDSIMRGNEWGLSKTSGVISHYDCNESETGLSW